MTHSTEPFDLISEPDAASEPLRDRLQALALASALAGPRERAMVNAADLHDAMTQALDLVQQLLLLRRVLIVLMQSTHVEALAVPFADTVLASTVPLHVRHDPHGLPNLLQVLLPGEGLVTISSSAYNEPPPSFDSEGATEVERLRSALTLARQALVDQEGRDTVLALIDVTLRR
jgi:hypothetical protein